VWWYMYKPGVHKDDISWGLLGVLGPLTELN